MPYYKTTKKVTGHSGYWLPDGKKDDAGRPTGRHVFLRSNDDLIELSHKEAEQFGDKIELAPDQKAAAKAYKKQIGEVEDGVPEAERLDGPMKSSIATAGPDDYEQEEETGVVPQTAADARRLNAGKGGAVEEEAVSAADLDDLLEGSGKDVIATVKTLEDTALLESLKTAEENGKNRSTVVDAIDLRIEHLKSNK